MQTCENGRHWQAEPR